MYQFQGNLCLEIAEKFKDFIIKHDELTTNFSNNKILKANEVITESIGVNVKEYMSKETEDSILDSINDFESSNRYLNKDISLNVMAAELGVNQRYLSYVIKKHKKNDFATYISELRINYIVNCLRNDPNFLKYKISYLAEKCGFSSHSRFTITFKKVTGFSPLTFINYLKEKPM